MLGTLETGHLVLMGVLMVAFAAVQYNDPDALFWAGANGTGRITSSPGWATAFANFANSIG